MSYNEDDAARDAFYEQVGNEAIGDFTADRLKSNYDDHEAVMQPALRSMHEGKRLLDNGHPSAAIVFSASAVELFLKATILQPLVYGLVHNDKMADIIVNYTLGQTGFERYKDLLSNLFREVAGLDFAKVRRGGSNRPLIDECKALAKQRNVILHRGDTLSAQDAATACEISQAVYLLFVEPMLKALNLYIFDDGNISRTEFRTIMDASGYRVIAGPITFIQGESPGGFAVLANGTIPVPPA